MFLNIHDIMKSVIVMYSIKNEKDIPYIFNRFYRVEKSRKRSLGGTGLGLSIVQELVHAHGAEITLKSQEQIGTEFEIIFKENEQ